MGVAYFDVSTILLQDLLALPEGTQIVGAEMADIMAHPDVRLYIEHPDLNDGERVQPQFRKHVQEVVAFEDWGREEP